MITSLESFKEHFSALKDPRITNHNSRHLMSDILLLTIIAVICGADTWVGVEEFGYDREETLKEFLELPNGIPSHDIIGDFFSRLCPETLQSCFISWVQSLCKISDGEIIAIDGKTVRRSYQDSGKRGAIHMVSAWASTNQLVLGQRKVDSKSNEIEAVPHLLKALELEGAIVTSDAMLCQKGIAKLIKMKGADYVLALKKNHGKMYKKIESLFNKAKELNYDAMVYSLDSEIDAGHGRIESRECTVLPLMYCHEYKQHWKGLQCVVKVYARRYLKDRTEFNTRYYISSLAPDAAQLNRAIRRHWSIENELHWVLDVSFNEDQARVRNGCAAENFTVLRHIALNLLKMEKTAKVGIKIKRQKAGWNSKYLAKVLEGVFF